MRFHSSRADTPATVVVGGAPYVLSVEVDDGTRPIRW